MAKSWNNFWEEKSFLNCNNNFVANLIDGGQLGRGFKAGALDAATPLALPPAVILVLQTPKMWERLDPDNEHILPMTIKSMFECHAKSVTGIDLTYNLETNDQPIGHDGQTFKVPTQAKRAEVTPNFTWYEVTGNLVWNLMMRWIWDINDPDTNAGLEFQTGDHPDAFTMSTYSLTFIALQYDQTSAADRLIDAAVYTNVFPQTTGELGLQREIGTTQVRERAIAFNGYVIHNEKTRAIGKVLATALKLRSDCYRTAAPNLDSVHKMFAQGDIFRNGIYTDNELSQLGNGKIDNWLVRPGAIPAGK